MSMLDSFFSKGFKASKCKTLLKLTIPRIKLLRNRREIQIRQMRRDIAKLLETGQEATARIRVEHIIREENMMAAQEIIELFSELIAVRLPIIETQRECPLDLKEAISSVCFAAPRCADLPELLQVQMLFGAKYGKEFLAAATGLMPECGVNRQLIELLSVRAPNPETKLKLLKEIAEEHGLDWDPAATETEFSKRHEDLLNGPTKLPLPNEIDDESFSGQFNAMNEKPEPDTDTDPDFEILDFPEVPKASLRSNPNTVSAPVMFPMPGDTPEEIYHVHELSKHSETAENLSQVPQVPEKLMREKSTSNKEDKQFVPFMSAPELSSPSFSTKQSSPPPALSRPKKEANIDLNDVLAAAQNAADAAERAAAAARSAASLAQIRIAELSKKGEQITETNSENPFHTDFNERSAIKEKPGFDRQNSLDDSDDSPVLYQGHEDHQRSESPDLPSVDKLKLGFDASPSDDHFVEQEPSDHQPFSVDDDSYLAYPNLFSRQSSNLAPKSHFFTDDSQSTHTTHGN